MDLELALQEYENYLERNTVIVDERHFEGICDDCGTAMLIEQRTMWLCMSCGRVEDIGAIVEAVGYVPKKSLYHRRSYFMERMNLICGYKQSRSKLYRSIVSKCRNHKFKTILDLRRIMKELGFHRFYKYIYNVYFDIKHIRLVKINQQRIPRLADEFIVMEGFFKQNRYQHNRKNLFSYSVIIYMLLKRNKIKGYSKILMPHSPKTLMKSITSNCLA